MKVLYIVMADLLYLVCSSEVVFVKINNYLNFIINIECVYSL